jgi:hypothetical protein
LRLPVVLRHTRSARFRHAGRMPKLSGNDPHPHRRRHVGRSGSRTLYARRSLRLVQADTAPSSSPRSKEATGTTTAACSPRSATSRRLRPKPPAMKPGTCQTRLPPDLNQPAPGKLAAVHRPQSGFSSGCATSAGSPWSMPHCRALSAAPQSP